MDSAQLLHMEAASYWFVLGMLAGSAGPACFYSFVDTLLSGAADALLRQTGWASRVCPLPSFVHLYENQVMGKIKKLIIAGLYGSTLGNQCFS